VLLLLLKILLQLLLMLLLFFLMLSRLDLLRMQILCLIVGLRRLVVAEYVTAASAWRIRAS
jgi:hypothetical protein